MEIVGSTVAGACNSKHLAAERTNLELTGSDVLTGPAELLSGPNGRVPSNASRAAKSLQGHTYAGYQYVAS
jgi:hypothetical protein